MRFIKVSIPVKTYIRKYIEATYPPPIKLTYGTTLGNYLYVCLEKPTSPWHKMPLNLLQKRYELINDSITVLLPADANTFYRTGFEVPPAKSLLINDLFEDHVIKEINFRMRVYEKVGYSRNQAIEDFCEEYNIIIDEDITQGALRKAEYRYRKNKNKHLPQMSPCIKPLTPNL